MAASEYQARWITKRKLDTVRKSGAVTGGIVLDSFNGFLIVEPVGAEMGDGPVLSREEAEFELQGVWCGGSRARLQEARRLVGLAPEPVGEVLSGAA